MYLYIKVNTVITLPRRNQDGSPIPPEPPPPPQWITFLIVISQKILLNIKDVEFEFTIGCILFLFQFLWMNEEKMNECVRCFPGQCLFGTILVTPCLTVWDWWVSRARPMPFYWLSCSLTFCLLLFSLSLLSFYGLVLYGWGLWTDRVLIALSQPCIANLFLK